MTKKKDGVMRESDKYKFDSDCQKPKHDEIVLWLYSKLDDQSFISEKIQPLLNDFPGIIIKKKVLEAPIGTVDNRGVYKAIGFCDLLVDIEYDVECIYESGKRQIEKEKGKLLFEIKTIVNVGETIRQIRYYNNGYAMKNWFVVAPGLTYEKLFKEQNIHYIEYKP